MIKREVLAKCKDRYCCLIEVRGNLVHKASHCRIWEGLICAVLSLLCKEAVFRVQSHDLRLRWNNLTIAWAWCIKEITWFGIIASLEARTINLKTSLSPFFKNHTIIPSNCSDARIGSCKTCAWPNSTKN